MDEERQKVKKSIMAIFLACICIALACFGIVAYLVVTNRGAETVNKRLGTISTIIVFIGIFFLVLAFGYLLPVLRSGKKQKNGAYAGGIFTETNMRRVLEKYIPAGETLLAGIHAVSEETQITGTFGKCIRMENSLIPAENGGTVVINKKKYNSYDIYIGITQYSLLIAECGRNQYYYQFEDGPKTGGADIREIAQELYYADIGTCFSLADIQNCEIKDGWMGSVKCVLQMKNGSHFKLMLPKLGGLGGDMPHHAEYREAILARLAMGKVKK